MLEDCHCFLSFSRLHLPLRQPLGMEGALTSWFLFEYIQDHMEDIFDVPLNAIKNTTQVFLPFYISLVQSIGHTLPQGTGSRKPWG